MLRLLGILTWRFLVRHGSLLACRAPGRAQEFLGELGGTFVLFHSRLA
jgi:hypothetical protein